MRNTEGRPAVYVGTYGKYNDGSIAGAWMYPGDYDTLDEFYEACKDLHKDEGDDYRELMFQDVDLIPDSLYSESCFAPAEFAFCKAWDECCNTDALEAFVDYYGEQFDEADELLDKFSDAYYGDFDSDEDFAYELVESTGMLSSIPENLQYYFDYEKYARDLMIDDFYEVDGHYFWRNV